MPDELGVSNTTLCIDNPNHPAIYVTIPTMNGGTRSFVYSVTSLYVHSRYYGVCVLCCGFTIPLDSVYSVLSSYVCDCNLPMCQVYSDIRLSIDFHKLDYCV